MRTIAFLTQKGGAGKTTLAASLAATAACTGERVIVLDLDPLQSLVRWAKRRETAKPANKVIVEPLERDRLPRLRTILEGLAGAGFTLAIFDTSGADATAVRLVSEVADLCLLPTRPTCLDVEAGAATFRAVFLAKRKAAFVLNQCPSSYHSTRASEAATGLTGFRPGPNPTGAGNGYAAAMSIRRQKQEAFTGTSDLACARSRRCLMRAASTVSPRRVRHSCSPCRLQRLSGCWQARLRSSCETCPAPTTSIT